MATKANPVRKETRARSRKNSATRKVERQQAQTLAAKTNTAAGKTPKRQTRKRKADNMRLCVRCRVRNIVAGSVCWCSALGVDQASRRAA